MDLPLVVELRHGLLDVAHIRVDDGQSDGGLAVPDLRHDSLAIHKLGQSRRRVLVLDRPIGTGRHPHGERLGPVFIRVLLGVVSGQVAHEVRAEGDASVLVGVWPRHRTEQGGPVVVFIELVGIVDHVAHFVTKVPQDVLVILAFHDARSGLLDSPKPLIRQVEGDADGHRAVRHPPFVGEIEGRLKLRDPALGQLAAKSFDHILERPAFDAEVKIANASVEDFRRQLVLRGLLASRRVFAVDGRLKLPVAIGWRLIPFRRSPHRHNSSRRAT